jgi:hypothetical protein
MSGKGNESSWKATSKVAEATKEAHPFFREYTCTTTVSKVEGGRNSKHKTTKKLRLRRQKLWALEVAHLVQGMEVKARVSRTLLAPVQGEAAPWRAWDNWCLRQLMPKPKEAVPAQQEVWAQPERGVSWERIRLL